MGVFRKTSWGIGQIFGVLVLAVLILYPLAMLLIQIILPKLFAVHRSTEFSLAPILSALGNPINLHAIINSVLLALGGMVLAAAIGLITSLSRASARSRAWSILIDTLTWIVLFTPSYIIAQGWVVLMQDGGAFSQLLHLQPGWSNWFFTRFGLMLVMGFKYFPFISIALQQALKNLGKEYAQAAQMSGANGRQIWVRIIMPLLMPGLLAGMSIAFAEGFGDFGFAAAITPTTQIPLVSYQIYAAMSQAPVDFSSAALLSLVLIIVTGAVLLFQFWWLNRKSYATVSASSQLGELPTQAASGIHMATGALLFIALALPVGGSILVSLWKTFFRGTEPGNWTTANYHAVWHVGSQTLAGLRTSLGYGLVTAMVAMLLALWLGYQVNFYRSRVNRLINTITMATIAIPGVVLAAGYIFAWNASWMHTIHFVIYGTSTCLAMAYIAGQVPYAVRLQLGAMSQIPSNLLSAARLLGASDLRILSRIVAPLVRATIVSTFFLAFTQTVFELPASMLLYPPGSPTFSVVANVEFSAFNWPLGSAIAITGMAVVLAGYGVGRWLASRAEIHETASMPPTIVEGR